jgi:hypothetical protein
MSRLAPALLLAALLPASALAGGYDLRGTATASDGSRTSFSMVQDGELVRGGVAVEMIVADSALGDVTLEGAYLSDGLMMLHGYAMAHLVVLEASCVELEQGVECAGQLQVVSDTGRSTGSIVLRGDDDEPVAEWSLAYDSLDRGVDADEEHQVSVALTHDTDFEAWATMFTASEAGGPGYERNGGGHCRLLKNDQDGIFSACTDADGELRLVIQASVSAAGSYRGLALAYVDESLPNREFSDLWLYAVRLEQR